MIKDFNKKVSRINFIKILLSSVALLALSKISPEAASGASSRTNGRPKKNIKADHDLVVATGEDPYIATARAVEAMGGMGRFVRKGD
ncbi:MAG: hypothetical protein KJ584_01705, partial [Candidatus Omnitrophica bacterium]|nr:hypothetical protein [Candidatus Omnitrophota bacterium]